MQVQVNQSQKSNTREDVIQLEIFSAAAKSGTPVGKEKDVAGTRPVSGSIAGCDSDKKRTKSKQSVDHSSNFDFVGVAG